MLKARNQNEKIYLQLVWAVAASFVLFQFFIQLSSGLVIGAIMEEKSLSALCAGLLGSSFYIVYTIMQIPVGLFFDNYNAKTLFTINTFICSLGAFIFAYSHSIFGLFVGRILTGFGASFAFVGFAHIIRDKFPLKKFAFMIGLVDTFGFIFTVVSLCFMGKLLSDFGWRIFMVASSILGLIITLLCYIVIPNTKSRNYSLKSFYTHLQQIVTSKLAWQNGFFIGFSIIVVTVFGGMWAIPFVQVKLDCSLGLAGGIGSMFFLGAAISCPLFGHLATHLNQRKTLILISCFTTAFLLFILIFVPMQSPLVVAILLCAIGTSCGAYMLAFSIANEIAPANAQSTCAGFTNTIAMVTAPILQPLIGYIMDLCKKGADHALIDYQIGISVIPFCILIAGILAWFLPKEYA